MTMFSENFRNEEWYKKRQKRGSGENLLSDDAPVASPRRWGAPVAIMLEYPDSGSPDNTEESYAPPPPNGGRDGTRGAFRFFTKRNSPEPEMIYLFRAVETGYRSIAVVGAATAVGAGVLTETPGSVKKHYLKGIFERFL
jgi:hypothetical protein